MTVSYRGGITNKKRKGDKVTNSIIISAAKTALHAGLMSQVSSHILYTHRFTPVYAI